MSGGALSLILDGIIILLLAGTIFYCVRLSAYLKTFRTARKDLEKLIGDLSSHIQKAERAIDGLRRSVRESGDDLEALIEEAKGLSSELQIMSESGNSLAGRLEKIADRNSRGSADLDLPPRPVRKEGREKERAAPASKGFAIRDREYEGDDAMDEEGMMQGDREEDADGKFASRAERELYEALRRKKTEAGGVS